MDTAELIRTSPLMTRADYDRAKDEGGIVFFDGTPNEWLSNFYPAHIAYNGQEWKTTEHAYQAMKFLSATQQQIVRDARGPGNAKYFGRTLKGMRPDWDTYKFQVMLEVVRQKFITHTQLREKLLETGDLPLVEGNTWHDNVWGFCLCTQCSGERSFKPGKKLGLNALGHTLMIVRSELLQTQSVDKFTYNEGDVEITPA